jgi:hypothetical protein
MMRLSIKATADVTGEWLDLIQALRINHYISLFQKNALQLIPPYNQTEPEPILGLF